MTTTWTEPTWADPQAIATAALAAMSLPADDPAAPAVQACAESAMALVDDYVGSGLMPVPTPPPVLDATVLATVELYRRKDAVFGVLNTWSTADFGPVRISTDWLKGVESLLHPYMRDSYGIG